MKRRALMLLAGAAMVVALCVPPNAGAASSPLATPAGLDDLLPPLRLPTPFPGRGGSGGTGCANADRQPTSISTGAARRATTCLINRVRARHGVRRLRESRHLRRAARKYARNMERKNFFSHSPPTGPSLFGLVKRSGYLRGARAFVVSEDLGWGTRSQATPREMVRGWLDSPGHRRNLLDRKVRHVGVGVAWGAPRRRVDGPAATYVAAFARRW